MVPCIAKCRHGIVGDPQLVGLSVAVLGGVESFAMAPGAHGVVYCSALQCFVERGSSDMATSDAGKTSFAGAALLCTCVHKPKP